MGQAAALGGRFKTRPETTSALAQRSTRGDRTSGGPEAQTDTERPNKETLEDNKGLMLATAALKLQARA